MKTRLEVWLVWFSRAKRYLDSGKGRRDFKKSLPNDETRDFLNPLLRSLLYLKFIYPRSIRRIYTILSIPRF